MTPPTEPDRSAEAASGSKILVIPVAKTAITVVVNPPEAAKSKKSPTSSFKSVMRGNIKNWGKIQTAFGPGCAGSPVTRVVRAEGSGTTYQFKATSTGSIPARCPAPRATRDGPSLRKTAPAKNRTSPGPRAASAVARPIR